MNNALASVGMRWQPSMAESADAARCMAADRAVAAVRPVDAAASAQKWSGVTPQVHGAQLVVGIDAARLRGYAFAIRPRGTPPV
jgi:hypothetical protein